MARGHVSLHEIREMVVEATRVGVDRIVITHALEPRFGATLSVEQQREMAARGAYIEHCYLTSMASGGGLSSNQVAEAVRAVGADRCVLTTDLGQKQNQRPAEGIRAFIAQMPASGLDEGHIEMMVKTIPARLLGL